MSSASGTWVPSGHKSDVLNANTGGKTAQNPPAFTFGTYKRPEEKEGVSSQGVSFVPPIFYPHLKLL
jgi:hypothetical protein